MSLERRERRRCDICGKIISNAVYYACRTETASVYTGDYVTIARPTWGSINNPPRDIDVCVDCWDKLKK